MLRTAIIGLGGVGTNLAREVVAHADAEIAALVDVDPDTLARASEAFDVDDSALYGDETEMYAETALDAVVVATPPAFHRDQIRNAFDRDLHVLCEKPVVMDVVEAREIVEWTDDASPVLMAGYQRHLDPGFVAARERWDDPALTPRFVTGELTQDWTGHFESGTNWRTDPEIGGGGHLFSVGTHVVESVLWMTGLTPETVTAEMDFYDDERRIDEQSSVTVRFENGTLATFSDSAVSPATREHIHAWDSEGAVYLDGEGWGRRELTVLDEDGAESTPELASEEARGKFEAFVDSVSAGEEPPATADDVHRVTALLEAAYESARTGRRVEVDP